MSWAVINLIEEIKDRITKAKTDGNASFKAIYIGGFEHHRKENDYPLVVIQVDRVNLNAECMKWGVTDESNISIHYITNTKDNVLNNMYDTSDSSGLMYELAVIMNYLEKNKTTGVIDLSMGGTVYNLSSNDISFRYVNNLILATISYSVKTAEYQRGAR